MSIQIATHEAIAEALQLMKLSDVPINLKNIRLRVGGGSMSTIAKIYNQIKTKLPEVPPLSDDDLRPVNANIHKLLNERYGQFKKRHELELDALTEDHNAVIKEMESLEKELDVLKSTLESLKDQNVELTVALKQTQLALDNALAKIDDFNKEQIRMKIKLEEFEKAKADAVEARDRAARLEGRLEAIEPRVNAQSQPAKKKGASKKN